MASVHPDKMRAAEVQAAIAKVRDPEIDETVAALDFIVGTEIDGDSVTVSLRLPTFWCPANFVFLMGGDIRDAVLALPWVRSFKFELVDHFAADEISRGISQRQSFAQVFPQHAENDLGDLRLAFDKKAFLMRQEALVGLLRRSGFGDDALTQMSVVELEAAAEAKGGELRTLAVDYLAKRRDIGLGDRDLAITTQEGGAIDAGALAMHLRQARKVTMSAQSNGEMCRILMAARHHSGPCAAHARDFISEKGNS